MVSVLWRWCGCRKGTLHRLVFYSVDAILIKRYGLLRYLYAMDLYCEVPPVAVSSRGVFLALG